MVIHQGLEQATPSQVAFSPWPEDLFIHDSLHSERNVRFESDHAWAALRSNGALVVDEVDTNCPFRSFTQTFPAINL
jgi:hypothetical protein